MHSAVRREPERRGRSGNQNFSDECRGEVQLLYSSSWAMTGSFGIGFWCFAGLGQNIQCALAILGHGSCQNFVKLGSPVSQLSNDMCLTFAVKIFL